MAARVQIPQSPPKKNQFIDFFLMSFTNIRVIIVHKSVRGIVKKDDGIILIHRIKKKENNTKREYYVVSGGKMEFGETEEQTVIRELKEELGINIIPKKKIIEYNSNYDDSIQVFYVCDYISGDLGTGIGEELTNKAKYEGLFEPIIVTRDALKDINLVPEEIKKFIIGEYSEL